MTQTTIDFVREWMMSGDHEVSAWERSFATAIDERAATVSPALMDRLYEVVRHDDGCRSIGGAGDKDCTCDAVPVLREMEALFRLPVGEAPRQRAGLP